MDEIEEIINDMNNLYKKLNNASPCNANCNKCFQYIKDYGCVLQRLYTCIQKVIEVYNVNL